MKNHLKIQVGDTTYTCLCSVYTTTTIRIWLPKEMVDDSYTSDLYFHQRKIEFNHGQMMSLPILALNKLSCWGGADSTDDEYVSFELPKIYADILEELLRSLFTK